MAGGAWTIHHPASSPQTRLSSGRCSSAWDLHPFSFREHQDTLVVFFFFFYTTNVNIDHRFREERLLKFEVLSCRLSAFRWLVISDQKVIQRSTFKIISAEKRQKKRVTNVMKTRIGVSSAVIPLAAARCHSKTREKTLSSLLQKTRITRQKHKVWRQFAIYFRETCICVMKQ